MSNMFIMFLICFVFLSCFRQPLCAHCSYQIANCFVFCLCMYLCSSFCVRLQSPPASAKVPKSVSDRKRFFENAMEDHNKPAPKSGEFKIDIFSKISFFNLVAPKMKLGEKKAIWFPFSFWFASQNAKNFELTISQLKATQINFMVSTKKHDLFYQNEIEWGDNDSNNINTFMTLWFSKWKQANLCYFLRVSFGAEKKMRKRKREWFIPMIKEHNFHSLESNKRNLLENDLQFITSKLITWNFPRWIQNSHLSHAFKRKVSISACFLRDM